MNQPLQPELWALILPAVRGARAAARRYLESGKYVPRHEVPKYEENAKGWPTTTSGRTFTGADDGPINWSYMFGEHKGPLRYIGLDEVPELAASTEEVVKLAEENPEFAKRMLILPLDDLSSEERQSYLKTTFINFIGDIISRAEATGAISDSDLLSIYLPLERARFANELPGDVVVPIALTALDANEPLELGPDLWIEPLEKSLQVARAVDWRGGRVSPYVIAAATHAIVIRDVTLDNRDPFLRMRAEADDIDVARVHLALQCLHIASGKEAGYAQVLIRPKGWADHWLHDLPPISRVGEYHRYPHRFDEGAWNQEKKIVEAEVVARLPRMYKALAGAEENVRVAARRALSTVLRSDDEDATLDAAIGLECLLGGGDKTEITHRIAQRAAAALATEDWNPDVVYACVKKVYAHRSAIVHGAKEKERKKTAFIKLGEANYRTSWIARWLLRSLLSNWLLAEPAWTPQILDEQILSALRRQAPGSTVTTQPDQ